ncbi:MAG: diacylglycerol/lipid kinase family protein [Thermoanaerobaculia bacterium]
MSERVCVIVNPAAGRGRGSKMLPAITSAFAELGVADIRQTRLGGDERRLADAAIQDGCTTIVAVGGDGTTGNVANAILFGGRHVRLGVLPAGTGNDFAKVLGTRKTGIAEMARLSIEESDARVDVGRVEDNYFLNACGFGFDVAVLQELERTVWLRGPSVYVWAALKQLFGYRGVQVTLSAGSGETDTAVRMLLVIANAPYFGGSFLIAPTASLADGKLDAISVRDLPAARRMSVLSAAIKGTHGRFAEVSASQAESYDVSFATPPWYETDGELHMAASASLRIICCPGALRVVMSASAASAAKPAALAS